MKPSFPHWGNLAQRLIRNSEQNIDVQHVWVISDVTTKICKLAKMEKIVVTHISFHKVWRRVRANRWPIGELPSLRATRVLGKQKQKKKKRNCTATKTTHWNTQIEAAIIPFFFPSHKPLLMSAWNRSVTALFGLIGIRCMSLTAEVEGFFFFLLRTFNSWSLLSLPESPLYFFWWIKQKKKTQNMQRALQNETLVGWYGASHTT